MKAELTHGNTPQDGHTVLATNLANDRCYAFSAYVMNAVPGKVAIACTHPDGIVIPPAEAMMCAEAIVNAVADADPEGFDALWMGLVASIRSARTQQPIVTNDPPAPYGDMVPRMAEDGTADVANYGEAQYLQGK